MVKLSIFPAFIEDTLNVRLNSMGLGVSNVEIRWVEGVGAFELSARLSPRHGAAPRSIPREGLMRFER